MNDLMVVISIIQQEEIENRLINMPENACIVENENVWKVYNNDRRIYLK